jgi:hypothetical protein
MNEEIKKAILSRIDKAHERENHRGIEANRERLAADLISRHRLELRSGKITDKNGVLQDIGELVEVAIDTASYLASREKAKYISKWNRPTPELRKNLADQVESVLKKVSKLNSIVPHEQQAYDRALWVLAKNFLYETTPEGEVLFAKLNENGLPGSKRFTFEEIAPIHLINPIRTNFSKELKEASRKELAKQLIGDIPKKATKNRKGAKTGVEPTTLDKDPIAEKVAFIRMNEILSEIPSKQIPQIPRSQVEAEIIRRESVARGLDYNTVITGGGQRFYDLTRMAKAEYDSMDNTSSIQQEIKAIQPQPISRYEGLSYE